MCSPSRIALAMALATSLVVRGEASASLRQIPSGPNGPRQQGVERPRGAAAQGAIAVEPSEVLAGMFYDGATIRVSAVVPRDAGVAILCRGEEHPLVLKKKGRVLGLLWMNVGDVSFESVPEVYLLNTSSPLASLQPTGEKPSVGFEALARGCGPDSAALPLFDELVRLKQGDGLWSVAEEAVHVQPAEEDMALATTDFRLPATAEPGVYQILLYTFRDGREELSGRAEIRVRRVGLSAFIATLAVRHGLLYGIMATLVAVAVGLSTGLFFGMGSKHGH